MNSRSSKVTRACALILGAVAAAPAARADAAADPAARGGQLEEITVTARKQAESILEVPFAVTALTAEDIAERNIKGILDLKDSTPGLYLAETNTGRNDRGLVTLVFRGIYSPSLTAASDAALLFVDGAPVLSGQLATLQNVERVEVLRGPQTAQFGRNTFSGALNIVTRTPGEEWAGNVSAEFDENSSTEFSGAVEGPLLAETLSFRLAAMTRDYHGTWDNNWLGGRLGDRSTDSASLTLHFHPGENVRLKLFGELTEYQDGPGASYDFVGSVAGNCDLNGDGRVDWFCGKAPDPANYANRVGNGSRLDTIFQTQVIDRFSMFSDNVADGPGLGLEALNSHAILDWDLPGGYAFQAMAAYHSTKSQVIDEGSRESTENLPCTSPACLRPFVLWQFLVERDLKDRYFEARISSPREQAVRFMLGTSYVDADVASSNVAGEGPPPTGARFFSNTGITRINTKGVFGALYWDVTDRFTTSAEVRWQSDDVRNEPFGSPLRLGDKFESVGGRIAVRYDLSERIHWFANVGNGFRPGLFNSRLLTLAPEGVAVLQSLGAKLTVDEEKIEQVETGIKGRFLDGRLQASLVGYLGRIKDQQVVNNALVPIGGGVTTLISYTGNTGKSDLRGIEFEGAANLGGGFGLDFSAAWNETEIKQAFCGNCIALFQNPNTAQIGSSFINAPKFQANLVGKYAASFGTDGDWYTRLEYVHTGSTYGDEPNFSESGDRNVLNARVGVNWKSVNVELYGLNLSDDTTPIGVDRGTDFPSFNGNGFRLAFPERRRFGVRANYRF
jgi:iron complex outermembrane receptor protein